MRKALIRNGIVENTIEADDNFFHPDENVTLVTTDIAGIGWSYDGTNFTAPIIELQPEPIPTPVELWKIKAVLEQDNLITQANNYVTASNNTALKAVWQYGSTIDRHTQSFIDLGTSIGLDSNGLDALFKSANAISL